MFIYFVSFMPHELTTEDPDKPTRITSFLNTELQSETLITHLQQIETWECELEYTFLQKTGKGFEIAILSYQLLREESDPLPAFAETSALAKSYMS